MVSDEFIDMVRMWILVRNKKMAGVVKGDVQFRVHGHDEDQYEGFGEELKDIFIPFRHSSYSPQEYLTVRIPVRNRHFRWVHQSIPILNYHGKYFRGISTYVTWVPYPASDTYVHRKLITSNKLVPYDLHVRRGVKAPQIIRKKMITSAAVNAMNDYSTLCWKLCGSTSIIHYADSKKLKVDLDLHHYPPGAFTIVPYHDHSILISKGGGGAAGYSYDDRYRAFSWVAKRLADHPEEGKDIGVFHMDRSLKLLLPPILRHIDETNEKRRVQALTDGGSGGGDPGVVHRVRKVRKVKRVKTVKKQQGS